MFHDADAWRMCASPLRIGQSSLKELGRLRVGEAPIPTLAALLDLVAGRVPLLLEVKVDRDIWRWIAPLRRALAGYRARLGVMSFDPRVSRLLRTNMPKVPRGLLVRADLPPLKRRLYLSIAAPGFVGVERAALGQAWVARLRRRMPIYAWTIRTVAERRQAEVQADALIWEADGRP